MPTDDMLKKGYVKSIARPDGNTTGVNFLSLETDGKRQDILIEAVPGLRRMAALAVGDVWRCREHHGDLVAALGSMSLD